MNKVSIIIPVYINNKELYNITVQCLTELINNINKDDVEVIIVDDGSKEQKYIDFISKAKRFSDIKIIHNATNLGFAKAVNNGIRQASNDLVLLMNNDVFVRDPDWLKIMMDRMIKGGYGIVAPALGKLNRSDWTYVAGEAVNSSLAVDKNIFYYPVGWCMLVKREVFNNIGLIPELFGQGFWEDSLFCYRAEKAGIPMGMVDELYANHHQDVCKIKHLYHTTFKSEGINLGSQYAINRKIFLKEIKK